MSSVMVEEVVRDLQEVLRCLEVLEAILLRNNLGDVGSEQARKKLRNER